MIGVQHAQVEMIEVFQTGGVIGIALHQHQLRVDAPGWYGPPLHITNIGCAGRQKHRFALAGNMFHGFQPGDLT